MNYVKGWKAYDICEEKKGDIRYYLSVKKSGEVNKTLSIIMMNPSKANLKVSDLTITKVINRANEEEYEQVNVFNVMPMRATRLSDFFKSGKCKYDLNAFEKMAIKNLKIIHNHLIDNSDSDIFLATGDLLDGKLGSGNGDLGINESVIKFRILFLEQYMKILRMVRSVQKSRKVFVARIGENGFPVHLGRSEKMSFNRARVNNDLSIQWNCTEKKTKQ